MFKRSMDMQSIDFQSGIFLKDLAIVIDVACDEFKNQDKKKIVDSDIGDKISSVIRQHTNLKTLVSLGEYDPCVEIPNVNKNNIMINEWIRMSGYVTNNDALTAIKDANKAVRGSVNLKKSKVDGVFSEFRATIHLPYLMFKDPKFSPEEIAAIILHETGHLFVYYEFMSRTATTNQILAGLDKGMTGSTSAADREVLLTTLKKSANLSELDPAELSKVSDKKIVEAVVLTNMAEVSRSQLGNNIYDLNSWEMLADQFAARHGASVHLATALEKIYRGSWNISFRSTIGYLAFEAFKIIATVGLPVLGIMLMLMDGADDGTYDRPGARLKRVRDQIVQNLKNKSLPKEDVANLTADIAAIDSILNEINDRRQFAEVLWGFVSPTYRRGRTFTKLQQELEMIATNDLFIKAAQLRA